MTQLLNSGPPGTKVNIAVLGDGFTDADQAVYNAKVQELLIDGVFGHDYYYEDKSAFNIYRVNLISQDSGVSTRVYDEHGTPDNPSDDTIVSTTWRNTALGYIYSGSWAHCWLENGPNTSALVNNALSTWVPDYNLVLVILNNPGFGGCGGGGVQIVTLGIGWDVIAHEFGHGYGGLADEYCTSRVYAGPEPGAANVTINTNRATLKWNRFVSPATPVPTGVGNCADYNQGAKPAGWSDTLDAGLFEGGGTNATGMYRPVINCRMRGNLPEYCPVCYTVLKTKSDPKTQRTFLRTYAGDFNGNGKDDLLLHNGNSILTYASQGASLDILFSAVGSVPGSWQFAAGDQFYVGDFNGDGKDEVVVFNGTNWGMPYLGLLADDGAGGLRLIARYDGSLPGWQFAAGDQFFVADFNGDGKDDLYVFNGTNWSFPYLAMLSSSGSGFSLAQRYDQTLAGWQMTSGDRFYVGDFDGDGKDDLYVFNGTNWSFPYLAMMRSEGAKITMVRRYDQTLPNWAMAAGDRLYVGDFNSDGKADLYLFNGTNWSIAYLGMFASTGTALNATTRYDGNVPGWQMRKNDQYWIGETNGKAGLFVFNWQDWATEYLGTMVSDGTALSASWSADWVGEWNLGGPDQFVPCDYEGVGHRRDLMVHNQDWFGLIRATPTLSLDRLYYRWIHNYRYGRNW
jgi:hypothetical protein